MRGALRALVAGALVAALTCAAGVAWPHSNGESGHSGKQGPTCNDCHGGGPPPSVFFDGPKTIEAGTLATYTLHVATAQPLAGMNVAATDGVALRDDDGGTTYLSYEELVHPRPLATDGGDGGEAVFTFSLEAPKYAGTVELWGAGNAVNGDRDTTGDGAQTTTYFVTIDGPSAPKPDAAAPPPPPPPPLASTSAPPAADSGARGGPSGDAASGSSSGCTVGLGSDAPAGALVFAALALVLARARARRTVRGPIAWTRSASSSWTTTPTRASSMRSRLQTAHGSATSNGTAQSKSS